MRLAIITLAFFELSNLRADENIQCDPAGYSIYNSNDDALCYWIKESDDLPLLDENEPHPPKSIYFIDSSCKGGLNAREACSVEAAAKMNPERQVYVFFAGPVVKLCLKYEPLLSLQSYKNIHLRRIYVDEYSNKTGFKHRLQSDIINEGPYPNLYALDLLKFLTLYKFDGVYMDLDIMATKPFDKLPRPKNWVAIEDHVMETISTAVFAASSDQKGRDLINSILRVIYVGMSSSEWSFENFNILRTALERLHGRIPFHGSKYGCSFTKYGLVVYASKFFFPVPCEFSAQYFDSNLNIKNLTKSFTQQLCNGMTFEIPITKNSTYAQLMSQFCPNVYDYLANKDFKEKIYKRNNTNLN